jgi:hypothetical protein
VNSLTLSTIISMEVIKVKIITLDNDHLINGNLLLKFIFVDLPSLNMAVKFFDALTQFFKNLIPVCKDSA